MSTGTWTNKTTGKTISQTWEITNSGYAKMIRRVEDIIEARLSTSYGEEWTAEHWDGGSSTWLLVK